MPDPPQLRLLALDGGGIRGLSALMILQQLMEVVDVDAPPKPCDYFDMIGGTSTGGLIAIMLGRLKMSIDECIDAYLQLSERIFKKKRHRVNVRGKIQGRFDSDELERAVKEVVKGQGLPEDALLKDVADTSCKVFVCATSKETSETVCLTSYRSPHGSDLLNSVKIWEACRATSAASSFFDPIAIGRYEEEFVDGATGANNPVVELWNQAQRVWGPEPLEGKVQCLISIGTGIPMLKAFGDDLLHFGQTLVAIATETEQTAERFRRDKVYLDSSNRYFRFNVIRGLEDIGLEETAKRKEIAAATRRYVASQDVWKQMQACADNLASREYIGAYRTNFSLEDVPRVKTFIERPSEMAELELTLLPQRQNMRQKIFVLHGLGGIGKTQLAVAFTRRHHRKFSCVFWLDGSSEVSLKLSIAKCASRIPVNQITDASRTYSVSSSGHIDEVVREVMGWLAQPDNTEWLIVFDNVDREHGTQTADPLAYDVRQYFSGADHGSVLITSRLARLEQLGDSQQVKRVDRAQAQEILKIWYRKELDPAESERLFSFLDGLPLAIAQAGAFLQESGVDLRTYLRFYEQQWDELMKTKTDAPIHDYPDRSVWTTWTISYNAIRDMHEATANLLLLWSFLDNKTLWHGLFARACGESPVAANMLTEWIGDIANNELQFSKSMQLLRNYSLVEGVEKLAGYATHPVVHRWAYHYQGKHLESKLGLLAVVTVGWALPEREDKDCSAMQRRLLPHAQLCSGWAVERWTGRGIENNEEHQGEVNRGVELETLLCALQKLGKFHLDQDKMGEAEKMYMLVLPSCQEALGPTHWLTLTMMGDLGDLYLHQMELDKAKQMLKRTLQSQIEAFGLKHRSLLATINSLGIVCMRQGKLGEAEKMYIQVLQVCEEVFGPKHMWTLSIVKNLAILYKSQEEKRGEAEKLYIRALQGFEEELGPRHTLTLKTVNNLGNLYADQGKRGEAEKLYIRALQGYEEVLGPRHTSTLDTVNNLGLLYRRLGRLAESEKLYIRALQGYEEAVGPKHMPTLDIVSNLGLLYVDQGKLDQAEKLLMRALQGYEEAVGKDHIDRCIPALYTIWNLGYLFRAQNKLIQAKQMLQRALAGFQEVIGPSCAQSQKLEHNLASIDSGMGNRPCA